jgi:hypothetical protein
MISSNRMCIEEGCNDLGEQMYIPRSDGTLGRRSKCTMHRGIERLEREGSYRLLRKSFCENIDGRLGFICTSTIISPRWQLDADHINNDHSDNRSENIQTLCKTCHPMKTKTAQEIAKKIREGVAL